MTPFVHTEVHRYRQTINDTKIMTLNSIIQIHVFENRIIRDLHLW